MLWANGLHKGDAAVLPRILLSGEVGVGQTYAVSKAITIPRLKKKGDGRLGARANPFFLTWMHTLFWQTCVMQLFVRDVSPVCLFGFVLFG